MAGILFSAQEASTRYMLHCLQYFGRGYVFARRYDEVFTLRREAPSSAALQAEFELVAWSMIVGCGSLYERLEAIDKGVSRVTDADLEDSRMLGALAYREHHPMDRAASLEETTLALADFSDF